MIIEVDEEILFNENFSLVFEDNFKRFQLVNSQGLKLSYDDNLNLTLQENSSLFFEYLNGLLTIINDELYKLSYYGRFYLQKIDRHNIHIMDVQAKEYNHGDYINAGSYGCVFKDNDKVKKVSFLPVLLKEYDNIKILPQPGPYYDCNEIHIKKVLNEEGILKRCDILSLFRRYYQRIKDYENAVPKFTTEKYEDVKAKIAQGYLYDLQYTLYSSIIRDYENNVLKVDLMDYNNAKKNIGDFGYDIMTNNSLYELILPFIPGETLCDYIESLCVNSPFIFKSSIKIRVGPIEILLWIKLLNAFNVLVKEVIELNNIHIYHNDLHLGNIMYDGHVMKLIDFGELSVGQQKTIHYSDVEYLSHHMKTILMCGSFSAEVRSILHKNGVIKAAISEDMFNYEGVDLLDVVHAISDQFNFITNPDLS